MALHRKVYKNRFSQSIALTRPKQMAQHVNTDNKPQKGGGQHFYKNNNRQRKGNCHNYGKLGHWAQE